MTEALHNYLAHMTRKAAENLEAAYLQLPEDKRHWSPGGEARTASNMVAECAIMNDISQIVETRTFPADFDYAAFLQATAALAQDEPRLLTTLRQSTERGVAALQNAPASDLGAEIPMPWKTFTLGEVIAYPFWNMSYHEGQINYIASQLTKDHAMTGGGEDGTR